MTAAYDTERLDILCDEIKAAMDAVAAHRDIDKRRLYTLTAKLAGVAIRVEEFVTKTGGANA